MTAYRALFCDLRTDQVRDTFPISGVSMEDYIGKTGTLSGTLTAPDRATADRIRAAVIPGRTAVWIERDGVIWWGGIVWTASLSSTGRGTPAKADIQAATFDSYLDHRLLTTDFTATDEDQFTIARRLISFAQSTDGGDIGIRLGQGASGGKRTRTYSHYDLPKIRELLDKLAAVQGGFEWRIRCYRDDAGERIKELQLGHPRITTSRGPADVILDYPGAVTAYTFPYDATTAATHWQSRGATSTGSNRPLMSTPLQVTGAIKAGWPHLDGTSDYPSVTTKAVLDDHAAADLTEAATRAVIPEITVALEAAHLTPAILGATIRLRIADVWSPAGFAGRYRVVGITVRAAERGQAETASLLLDAANRGTRLNSTREG
ncbi:MULTISPECIES: hypothetical protein [unclassified Streptomyces]|uniref:hypothetical protein n=1 Tax=unclassified Streptomyces TaxID=2593676 RepID=UPI0003601A23|nr:MULTISPECIES: hypothetical protein [unclassified Streptomyces]MYT30461.1 hypothetical protein [Streptomyces sp. SID8354]